MGFISHRRKFGPKSDSYPESTEANDGWDAVNPLDIWGLIGFSPCFFVAQCPYIWPNSGTVDWIQFVSCIYFYYFKSICVVSGQICRYFRVKQTSCGIY